MAFDSFKIFVVVHWTQIDYDLDSRTRKQIEEVFAIENSTSFKFFQFCCENLDPLFRFGYANCFMFFLLYFVAKLYYLDWLHIAVIVVFVCMNVFWILGILLIRMKKSNKTFCGAINFYFRCFCIFPKKQKKFKIVDDDEKL
jgi:hypothetical protein